MLAPHLRRQQSSSLHAGPTDDILCDLICCLLVFIVDVVAVGDGADVSPAQAFFFFSNTARLPSQRQKHIQ